MPPAFGACFSTGGTRDKYDDDMNDKVEDVRDDEDVEEDWKWNEEGENDEDEQDDQGGEDDEFDDLEDIDLEVGRVDDGEGEMSRRLRRRLRQVA